MKIGQRLEGGSVQSSHASSRHATLSARRCVQQPRISLSVVKKTGADTHAHTEWPPEHTVKRTIKVEHKNLQPRCPEIALSPAPIKCL